MTTLRDHRRALLLGFFLLVSFGCPQAIFSETIELVTYYPSSANSGNLHVTSITVGTEYQNVNLDDGEAIIRTNLGIGPGFDTLAPAGPLHVMGENNVASNVFFMPGSGTGTMRVGIGTLTPPSLLGVGGDGGGDEPRQAITIGNAGHGSPTAEGTLSNGDKLVIWNNVGNNRSYKIAIGMDRRDGVGDLWLQSSGQDSGIIRFYTSLNSTAPVERMRISHNGNVGIGTNGFPDGRLEVRGEDDAMSRVLFVQGNNTAAPGTPTLRVGIGTTTPNRFMHAVGMDDVTSEVVFVPGRNTADPGTPAIEVGIGTDNPSSTLDVAGNLRAGNLDAGRFAFNYPPPNTLRRFQVNFNKTFSAPPNVVVTLQSAQQGLPFALYLRSVTTTTFDFEFQTSIGGNGSIHWIAFDQ